MCEAAWEVGLTPSSTIWVLLAWCCWVLLAIFLTQQHKKELMGTFMT